MQQVITWAVLAVYLAAMLTAGIVGAKKANTLTNFVVGGRKAGPWVSALASARRISAQFCLLDTRVNPGMTLACGPF